MHQCGTARPELGAPIANPASPFQPESAAAEPFGYLARRLHSSPQAMTSGSSSMARDCSPKIGNRTKASSPGNRWDAFFRFHFTARRATPAGTERRHEETQTGGDRQRHGRGPHSGRAPQARPDLYDITLFGAEPHPNYNRILLSPVLAGEQDFDDIVLNDLDWYAAHGIELRLGRTVVAIDRPRRRVIADDGSEAAYDRLLIATGSSPSSCRCRATTCRACSATATWPTPAR